MSGVNYYQLLGIHPTASDGEIRRAYLRLSLQYHPDKRRTRDADGDELYRSIQEAYETLSCPEKRCLYDFVGSFAALAELTASPPMAMPPYAFWLQRRYRYRGAAADPLTGISSGKSSYGETHSSWGTSSLASASRLSSCPSSDTNLSSSPGAATGSSVGSDILAATCSDPAATASTNSAGGGPSFAGGGGGGDGSVSLGDSTGQSHMSSSSPITSPGALLGKRRTPGDDDTRLHVSSHHPDSSYRSPVLEQQPQAIDRAVAPPAASCVCMSPGSGRRTQAADVHHRLPLTLEEMYSGCVKQLRLARRVYGRPLTGPTVPGRSSSSSSSMAPEETQVLLQEGVAASALQEQQQQQQQQDLKMGEIENGNSCSQCVEELFRVVVQPGWREGTKVTFPGKGDELPCGSCGDMVLVVSQATHGRYERRGNDLHTMVVVPLVDALTGSDTAITTLDGRTLLLQLGPACLQPFSECVVKGEGMPILPGKNSRGTRGGGGGTASDSTAAAAAAAAAAASRPATATATRGDLHVRFEVAFPTDLTPEQKAELRQALVQ